MRGLTRLEIDLLLDASSSEGEPRVMPSPAMTEACFQLRERRLIIFIIDLDGWQRGVITALGKLVLSIVLTEPSLVAP